MHENPPELKPFEYQIEGGKFLKGKTHALLADEMGLGKTVQAILGLVSIHATRALIICPSVARINWLRELEMWIEAITTKDSYNHDGAVVITKLDELPPPTGHIICSFEYATENYKILSAQKWDALIVDEAHYLKSSNAKRSQAIMGREGIIRSSKRCWLLSGTPAPNDASELWIPLYTFGVTNLSYDAFVSRYCLTRETTYGRTILGNNPQNVLELKRLLSSIMLRRKKDDVLKQLPHISYTQIAIEPGEVDWEIQASFAQYYFPEHEREALQKVLKDKLEIQQKAWELMDKTLNFAGDHPSSMNLYLQGMGSIYSSISTLRRYVGLQKVQPSVDLILEEMRWASPEKKIVIFAIHRDVIEGLRVGLKKYNPVVLYGRMDPEKKQKNIDKFQKNPKCRIFIGNIQAAGVAVTLTAANKVIFVELDWVPGNNAQAVMRVHRIGQERRVVVQFNLLDQSLDQKIGLLLKRKVKDLTEIFE